MALNDMPSFISARSANTIISENRPTRIQAETLLILNALLDELLLSILSSAKSLATDRIKTDGMLKIFGNNLLAKDAVLEAELELRSYVEGKRAEGAKVPLGLMATSRVDGTDGFPVQSAYKALRVRCQYYSTLGDCDDEGASQDQNLMSTDGRPVATVTPMVAVYVTALLEFVGQHILQNVSRVIERDNSDEASLYDLRAAITEDEQLNPLYEKMSIKQEVLRRIDAIGSRTNRGAVKPWHVPAEGDFDEAAETSLFSSKRASIQQPPSTAASSSRNGHTASSSLGHAEGSSLRGSMSTLRTSSSVAHSNGVDSNGTISASSSAGKAAAARPSLGRADGSSGSTQGHGRRPSSDRSWSGVFGSMKRRNSFKQGSDPSATPGRPMLQTNGSNSSTVPADSPLDPTDDFEALMLSSQTMKVSLTPNRLHTIEVAKDGDEANIASVRRRPGAAHQRDGPSTPSGGTFPSDANTAVARTSTSSAIRADQTAPRTALQPASRPERKLAAPPPSSYRSPSPALVAKTNLLSREVAEEDAEILPQPPTPTVRSNTPRLQPRDDGADRSTSTNKDLVDLFNSTPPSSTHERFGTVGSDSSSFTEAGTKKPAMGDRVRSLFGRRSTSSSGHTTPSSPVQKQFRAHQRSTTKASLEGSQDTYVTSSTTNSIDQPRSLISPNEVPFNRPAASRSSTSTSEQPTVSSDAAMEVKPKPAPAVSVVEPEQTQTNGANGLGIGLPAAAGAAVAAGTVAVARSGSYGSRTASYGSQAQSNQSIAEGAEAAETAAQEDTLEDDASASSSSKTKAAEELVSRKVPWGYKRNSNSTNTMAERADRRRSMGYTSSSGHGALSVRGLSNGASSDHGHGSLRVAASSPSPLAGGDDFTAPPTPVSATPRSTNAPPTSWTGPAFGSHTLVRRGSLGARPSAANQQRQPGVHLETIQLLAELERAMRNCHSVDECRELVRKAMHSDGASLSPSETRANGVVSEDAAQSEDKSEASFNHALATATGAALAGGAVASIVATAGSDLRKDSNATVSDTKEGQAGDPDPNLTSLVPTPKAEKQSTSLERVDQGLVVAWLLGGDDDPASPAQEGKPSGDVAEKVDRHLSTDTHASHGHVHGRTSGSDGSLHSKYGDAQDEVAAE